jgi:hypothetical protein
MEHCTELSVAGTVCERAVRQFCETIAATAGLTVSIDTPAPQHAGIVFDGDAEKRQLVVHWRTRTPGVQTVAASLPDATWGYDEDTDEDGGPGVPPILEFYERDLVEIAAHEEIAQLVLGEQNRCEQFAQNRAEAGGRRRESLPDPGLEGR